MCSSTRRYGASTYGANASGVSLTWTSMSTMTRSSRVDGRAAVTTMRQAPSQWAERTILGRIAGGFLPATARSRNERRHGAAPHQDRRHDRPRQRRSGRCSWSPPAWTSRASTSRTAHRLNTRPPCGPYGPRQRACRPARGGHGGPGRPEGSARPAATGRRGACDRGDVHAPARHGDRRCSWRGNESRRAGPRHAAGRSDLAGGRRG